VRAIPDLDPGDLDGGWVADLDVDSDSLVVCGSNLWERVRPAG